MHGDAYNFWSGVGNDIPVFIAGYLFAFVPWYLHNRCHYPRCHRFGKHEFHHYKLCSRHHPAVKKNIPLHISQLHKDSYANR